MKIRSLLFAFILSVLFLSEGMATQAQTLDQTLSGCNGLAPLRTIQATPSNYLSLIAGLLPGDRLQLAAGTHTQGLNPLEQKRRAGQVHHHRGARERLPPCSASGCRPVPRTAAALFTGSHSWNLVSLRDSSYFAVRNLSLDGLGKRGSVANNS